MIAPIIDKVYNGWASFLRLFAYYGGEFVMTEASIIMARKLVVILLALLLPAMASF